MDISIRQILAVSGEKEINKYKDAYLKMFNEKQNLLFLSFTNQPFTGEMVENWLNQAGGAGVEYYTACGENGDIVGIICLRHDPVSKFEIMSVVVDRACRNTGIGGMLLDQAVNRAREMHYKSVETAVFADNANMLSLVVKKNFKPVGIGYRARFDGEDIVYLKRFFVEGRAGLPRPLRNRKG